MTPKQLSEFKGGLAGEVSTDTKILLPNPSFGVSSLRQYICSGSRFHISTRPGTVQVEPAACRATDIGDLGRVSEDATGPASISPCRGVRKESRISRRGLDAQPQKLLYQLRIEQSRPSEETLGRYSHFANMADGRRARNGRRAAPHIAPHWGYRNLRLFLDLGPICTRQIQWQVC